MSDTTRTVATPDESIAVVGMSCRLPRADDPAAFWRLLRDGVEAVGETPAHRWDPATLGSADAPALAHGAFLAHVDRFDAAFFGIGPAEAAAMDPQQRLVLELAWEALEDARITPDRLIGSSTGVFVGAIWDDWSRLLHGHGPDTAGQYGLTGTHRGIIANRVSYALGLRGPSLTIDSAQSSSLVAVHAACASLRSGESTLALVGGVNLNLLPESAAALGRLGALSHDGHVRLLDAEATGTVRGEGGALLVLKPLRAALADGDRVVCVIRGSAVNNDGATDGLTTPNPDAQRAVILAACRRAAVDPTDLQYVELHGTGTPVGDPVEAGAVGRAAGAEAGRDDGPLRVGSVKSNLGHLEAAAGVVGLLKVALSLRHRALPPTLNHLRPHPDARLDAHHLQVQTEHGPWPHPERELVAGVNSWGIGGTNCHVVLSEAPAAPETSAPATDGLPCVWPVSARTGTALRAQADRLHAHLTGTDPSATSDQVGYALAVTRTAFRRRGAAVGTTRAELLEGLRALADGTTSPHLVATPAPAAGPTPLAVLFGGGGSQRPGMGAELYATHPVYAAAFDAVCDELDRHLPQPVRPLIFTEPDTPEARLLDRTDFALPALLAVEVALYRLYESWGLRPTLLTGHSMGELTAAHIAGVLSLPDVCELAAVRARLIQSAAGGAMAALQASEDEVLAALDEFSAAVSVAGVNAPDSTVISGDEDAVLELCARWHSRGRKTKRIAVTVAGHSPHMDGILDEFRTVARRLTYSPPRIPVVSNVTGTVATVEQITDPEYWVRHVRATVRFADGLRTLHSEGVTTYLELSPSPVLAPAVGTCLDGEERRPVVITTLQRDRTDTLGAASALAALFTAGHDIDWSVVFPPGTPDCDLPTYAFQRRSHWPRFDTGGRPARAVHITGDVTETSEPEDEHPLAGLRGDALRAAVRDLVETAVTAVLGEDDDEPDGRSDDGRGTDRTFKDRGFTSLRAVEMRDRLETATGLRLPAGLLFDHPTADALVEHLCRTLTGDADVSAGVVGGVVAVDEPLAIVGMACRFPGGVGGPEDLWRLVAEDGDVVGGFPEDRGWDLEGLFDPDPDHTGTSYARAGGFLHEAAGFDAEFFGISPREALAMDPQQRLLLETAWEALEHARVDPHGLRGSRTGVFTGVMDNDYASGLGQGESTTEGIDGYLLTGRSTSVASGRLAYVFGFEGPAVSVDTACSSSLVALHLAGQALRLGECDLALAGGVTVMSTPSTFVEFSRQRGLSPDGRCRAFSADADGTGWAEGVGLLVVERLSDAVRRGHRVWAVVRGSAVNQDGASNGLTAPNGPSQQRVIRQAWASAGVSGADIDVVEAHGTGTRLGDPIEAQAILATYGIEHDPGRPLWLGSLKSNIGHAQAAAGVGGVIKMVMALHHETLPRTLHVGEPTPHVDWGEGAVRLLTEPVAWPAGPERARRAAVSSFGISGTNTHVILEEAPAQQPVEAPAPSAATGPEPVVWNVSASSEGGLRNQARKLAAFVRAAPDLDVYGIGHALATGRAVFGHRAAVVGRTRGELLAGLESVAAGRPSGDAVMAHAGDTGKLALVFAGQGSQRVGMGRELQRLSPVFAAAFDEVCAAFDGLLDRPLRELILSAETDEETLAQTGYAQPAVFAVEVALFRLLESLGVRPDYVAGHSIGELVAAYVAGVWSLPDAARLVAARGRLMQGAPAGGAMVSLRVTEAEVRASLEALGVVDTVSVAAVNGPRQTVISGDTATVERVAEHWRAHKHRTRKLLVSHAFHSAHMDGALEEFQQVAATVRAERPRIPLVSADTARVASPEELADPAYWAGHIRRTVRFADAVGCLREEGVTTFLEIAGHQAVAQQIEETLETLPAASQDVTVASVTPNPHGLVGALARSHVTGTDVDWPAWFIPTPTTPVDLPTYPFDHRSYWLADDRTQGASATPDQATWHPLLGPGLELAGSTSTVYSGRLSPRTHPNLADPVTGTAQLPGTALLELALRLGEREGVPQLDDLTLEQPLPYATVDLQVTLEGPDSAGLRALSVHARRDGEPWTLHARGLLAPATATGAPDLSEGAVDVTVPEHGGFAFHPAALEAALRPLLPDTTRPDTVHVPTSWRGALLHAPDSRLAGDLRIRVTPTGPDVFSLTVTDASDALVATVDAMGVTPVPLADLTPAGLLHHVVWEPVLGVVAPDTPQLPEPVVVRVSAGDAVEEAVATVLAQLQDRLAGDGRVVVVTASGDAAGAAVGGLVRSVQAEYPGRFFLVEAETDCGEEVLRAALASDEPHVRVRDGGLLAPRLTRVAEEAMAAAGPVFGSEGTVLVTGATGTLGRVVVRHLVERYGVRDVVLVSRSGRLPEDLTDLHDLSGVRLRAVACDVADREALAGVIAEAASALRGVVHAAGVLDDATVANLTPERVARVWGPKAEAARHLHELTRDLPLDAFVLFSSAAGVIGTAGQANYAAANAFLDQLAADRHAHGLPAHSLAWGLWEETSGMTGQLAAADRTRLARLGIAPLSTEDALALFDAALTTEAPALVAAHFDPAALRTAAAEEHLPPLLGSLVEEADARPEPTPPVSLKAQLEDLAEPERVRLVLDAVRAEVAAVLGHDSVDEIDVEAELMDLGFDSLTAVELRNRLNALTGLRLSSTLVFDYPTTLELAEYLHGELAP